MAAEAVSQSCAACKSCIASGAYSADQATCSADNSKYTEDYSSGSQTCSCYSGSLILIISYYCKNNAYNTKNTT